MMTKAKEGDPVKISEGIRSRTPAQASDPPRKCRLIKEVMCRVVFPIANSKAANARASVQVLSSTR